MRAIAAAVSVAPGQNGFTCHDPTLAQRLTQAADQADQPATLNLREASFNEGPAGVANAIKRLWENIGTYLSSLFGYVSSGGKTTGATTHTGQPITGRDMIALLATIGIDLGLLALSILNPPPAPSRRPSSQVIRQIRAAINTAIERAPGANMEWVRRHFINHKESSYLVIPNLYSCDPKNEEEGARALAMNQLAGVLDDLNLVRWPHSPKWWRFQKNELKQLKAEESEPSLTDLTDIRKKWIKEKKGDNKSEEDAALREGAADPQSRAILEGRTCSDHCRLERESAPRHRNLSARGRRGADADPDGARRRRQLGDGGSRGRGCEEPVVVAVGWIGEERLALPNGRATGRG